MSRALVVYKNRANASCKVMWYKEWIDAKPRNSHHAVKVLTEVNTNDRTYKRFEGQYLNCILFSIEMK